MATRKPSTNKPVRYDLNDPKYNWIVGVIIELSSPVPKMPPSKMLNYLQKQFAKDIGFKFIRPVGGGMHIEFPSEAMYMYFQLKYRTKEFD